jgi:hypothetical protein
MNARWRTLGISAVLSSCPACTPTDACAEPGACGGDPVGLWTMVDSCQDPSLPDPVTYKRQYRGQPVVAAGQPPPEPTSSDWCADIVFGAHGIDSLNLPRDTPKLLGAILTFQADDPSDVQGTYSALVTSSDTTSIEFSKTCLTRFGYSATCADFGVAFATFATGLGGVKNTNCADAAGGGCVCAYTSESDAAGTNLSGRWRKDGSVLTLYASNMILPTKIDYCSEGNRMTVWGHDRTNIMDIAGARIMTFVKKMQ